MDKVAALTEVAPTCRKKDGKATIDARLNITDFIILRSSLWRLIRLDEHLAETVVQ